MTCALVLPKPKELTPAKRLAPDDGGSHGVSRVGTASRVPSKRMCGLSVRKFGCGGIAHDVVAALLVGLRCSGAVTAVVLSTS